MFGKIYLKKSNIELLYTTKVKQKYIHFSTNQYLRIYDSKKFLTHVVMSIGNLF